MKQGKIIIITAPSGSGKTTLVKELLKNQQDLSFSVSACTRVPRKGEIHGKDYYFFDIKEFKTLIEKDAFAEWEMVYEGKYYGTLKTELERIWQEGKTPLVDIDVKGALSIKNTYPDNSLSIFIKAPSIEELRNRLQNRGTETPKSLEERITKASEELTYSSQFDTVLINEQVAEAANNLTSIVNKYLQS